MPSHSYVTISKHNSPSPQLRARIVDFKAGALNAEYFRARVQEVADAIHQFEKSSMPTGWVCKWNAKRYVDTYTRWFGCFFVVVVVLRCVSY